MTPKAHKPGFLALVEDARSRVRQIDIEAYRRMTASGEPHQLIDVREDQEWTAGHASGAIHIGKGVLERDIETQVPDKHARLVLYCGGGYRPRSQPTRCSAWAIPAYSHSRAAGAQSKPPACPPKCPIPFTPNCSRHPHNLGKLASPGAVQWACMQRATAIDRRILEPAPPACVNTSKRAPAWTCT